MLKFRASKIITSYFVNCIIEYLSFHRASKRAGVSLNKCDSRSVFRAKLKQQIMFKSSSSGFRFSGPFLTKKSKIIIVLKNKALAIQRLLGKMNNKTSASQSNNCTLMLGWMTENIYAWYRFSFLTYIVVWLIKKPLIGLTELDVNGTCFEFIWKIQIWIFCWFFWLQAKPFEILYEFFDLIFVKAILCFCWVRFGYLASVWLFLIWII